MRFLLDSNAVIAFVKDIICSTARQIRGRKPEEVGISSIVVHELYYGAYKSQKIARNVAIVESLQFEIVEFDEDDAREAGEIRALLALRGTPIGPYDVLIAGQAIARDLIMVTRNTAEFSRVPGLRIEDWERARGKRS
jgi:tRNA(fMet)-specific endonuclease VapC